MQGCHNISALAKELDVPRRLLYRWQMRMQGPVAPIAPRYPGLEEENRQLKQAVGEDAFGKMDKYLSQSNRAFSGGNASPASGSDPAKGGNPGVQP